MHSDAIYLRHKVIGLVFRGSDMYQDKAEVVEKLELSCKVVFHSTRLEIFFKREEHDKFVKCDVFQYGGTFFKRCGVIKEMGKRCSFCAEEIIGVRRELNELSRDIAIFRAVVDEARNKS